MKKIILVIIIILISIFIGYKSYSIINKSGEFKDDRISKFIKPDLMGEIESISKSEIILKIIKSNIPILYKNNIEADFKIEYINEKKNILITSDTKIYKNSDNEKRMELSEINISDLKVGDILSLTYEKDKSTIYKIVLNNVKIN